MRKRTFRLRKWQVGYGKRGGEGSKKGGVGSGNRGAFFRQFAKLRIVSSRFLVLPSGKKKERKSEDLKMKMASLAGENGGLRYGK